MTHAARPTRPELVAAVADWLDAHALDALTLESVARDLGLDPAVLTDTFGTLAALRRELRLRALQAIGSAARAAADAIPACSVADPSAQRSAATGDARCASATLVAIASAVRTFAANHPGLYDATIESTHGTDPELHAAGQHYLGVFVEALSTYRLEQVQVIHCVRSTLSAIHGFVMLGRGGAFGMPIGIDESFEWLIGHLANSFETHS